MCGNKYKDQERLKEDCPIKLRRELYRVDEIEIEPSRRQVKIGGKNIVLSPKEYDLLLYFIENKA